MLLVHISEQCWRFQTRKSSVSKKATRSDPLAGSGGLSFAFSVKGVVNDKFAFENFMIAQTERAETMRNPAQTFAGGMGIGRMRVRGLHDLTQQKQGRFAQVVF